MSKLDLDKQRDAVIEEIKRVFPVKPRPKEIVEKQFRENWEGKQLIELLEDKSWTDLVDDYSFVYTFGDIDDIQVMTEKTYTYFLPAFLVQTMMLPNDEASTNAFVEIMSIAPKIDVDQLQALVSYFTYQEQYWREESFDMFFVQKIEDILLRLLFLLDEKKPKS
jgi:hypothetical protein